MATASGELRNDPKYWNWVKSVHGLFIVRDALVESLEKEFKQFHSKLLDALPPVCKQCTLKELKCDWETKIWSLSPSCEPCRKWAMRVVDTHSYKHLGAGRVNIKKSDLPSWSDSTRGPWEITKFFMPSGHSHESPATSDCAGLLGVLDNFSPIKGWLKQPIREKISTMRNELIHAGILAVDEEKLNVYFTQMEIFLTRLEIKDYKSNEFEKRLKELKREANPAEKLEQELQALREQIENLRRDIENEEDAKKRNALVQSFNVTLDFVAMHEALSDHLHDCMKAIGDVLKKLENRVTNNEVDIAHICKKVKDLELSKEQTIKRTEITRTRTTTKEKIIITESQPGAGDMTGDMYARSDLPNSSNISDELSPLPQMSEKTSEKKKPAAKASGSGDGEKIMLSKKKFATASKFKGNKYIDIREYYYNDEDDELKPGNKGIALNQEQWNNLKQNLDAIDQALENNPAAKTSGSGDGEKIRIDLSKMKFATVSMFKGKIYVNIREYFCKDGVLNPGRKGIALNQEQWNNLKQNVDALDQALKNL